MYTLLGNILHGCWLTMIKILNTCGKHGVCIDDMYVYRSTVNPLHGYQSPLSSLPQRVGIFRERKLFCQKIPLRLWNIGIFRRKISFGCEVEDQNAHPLLQRGSQPHLGRWRGRRGRKKSLWQPCLVLSHFGTQRLCPRQQMAKRDILAREAPEK